MTLKITLTETQSICPVCRKVIPAVYETGEDGDSVLLTKVCPEHGRFSVLAAENKDDFITWIDHPIVNIPPKAAMTQGNPGECPLHCGTCSEHLQTACCVLIDVTERCNQHCPYCFAVSEDKGTDVPLEEIEKKYDLLMDLGEERPFNIQLSGGEPTVRDDLPEIIKMGRDKGFEYIQINSNGKRIAEEPGYAQKLKSAGASVIFMQFDGTKPEIYERLRGRNILPLKLKAIEECRKARLPVTLVPTVVKDANLDNLGEIFDFMLANVDVVKGIHFQPVSFFGRHPESGNEERVTMFNVMHKLEEQTRGLIKYEDLCPITTGHTLCCFTGTYLKEKNGSIKSLISEDTKRSGVSCCDAADPLSVIKKDRDFVLNKWQLADEPYCCESESETECCCSAEPEPTQCCCEPEPEATCCCSAEPEPAQCCCEPEPETTCCCCEAEETVDLDEFLNYYKTNMFTISGMAFMDESNLDAERLKRCRVQVLSPDDKLIPFCAYNSIYRK